jgi:hypothetical protein
MKSILSGKLKFSVLSGMIAALGILDPAELRACSICFYGDPQAALSRELIGLAMGIVTLLGVLSVVLFSFGKFFINFRRRARIMAEHAGFSQGVV